MIYNIRHEAHLVGMFFGLLFLGLFLGDGKQPVVDVYGATAVMILWIFRLITKGKMRPLPLIIARAWALVWFVALVSTMTSSDIGHSLSWLVRLASGFLVYMVFYSGGPGILETFSRSALWFVLMAAGASIFAAYTPLASMVKLPTMNLVAKTFGHNHVANILVFAAPLVWEYARRAKHWVARVVVLLYYVAALVLTWARGAWFIVGLFVCISGWREKKKPVFILALVVAAALFALTFIPVRQRTFSYRLEYWRQALTGIHDYPLLGYGPGTFSLLSEKEQADTQMWSWFAHSAPLQIGAEMGLMGLGAFVWLVVVHVRFLRRLRPADGGTPLVRGVFLLGAYAMVEFVLDHFIVWLLFWAAVGVCLSADKTHEDRKKDAFVFPIVLFLALFYISWVGANIVSLTTKRADLSFIISPYDVTNTLLYIKDPNVVHSRVFDIVVLTLHRRNPEVLFAYAGYAAEKGWLGQAATMYERAVSFDPHNESYTKTTLDFLVEKGADEILPATVQRFCTLLSERPCALPTNRLFAERFRVHWRYTATDKVTSFRERLQKTLYLAGLDIYEEDPEFTRALWKSTISLQPQWGYYHVELAALEYYVFNDASAAQTALFYCQTFTYTREWCATFVVDVARLPPVGTHKVNILAIPEILPW